MDYTTLPDTPAALRMSDLRPTIPCVLTHRICPECENLNARCPTCAGRGTIHILEPAAT